MYVFKEDKELEQRSEKEKREFIIKTVEDAVNAFDFILKTFSQLETDITRLLIIFFNEDWNLEEGINDSLREYSESIALIRDKLTVLEMMNASLNNFLINEKRPIPVTKSSLSHIVSEINAISKKIKWYYKAVKGTLFPRLDDEINRCNNIIERINKNIDRINSINSAYRKPRLMRIHQLLV